MNKPPLVSPRTVVRAGISNSGKSKSKSGQGKSEFMSGSSVKGISSLTLWRLKGELFVPPTIINHVPRRIKPNRSRIWKLMRFFRQ